MSQQDWDSLRETIAHYVRNHNISDLYAIAKVYFDKGELSKVDLVVSEICEWEPRYLRYIKEHAQDRTDLKLQAYLVEKIG